MRRPATPSVLPVLNPEHHEDPRLSQCGSPRTLAKSAAPDPLPLMVRGISAGCRLTGLGERTVWSLINRNALPHHRGGRAVMFAPEEVAAGTRPITTSLQDADRCAGAAVARRSCRLATATVVRLAESDQIGSGSTISPSSFMSAACPHARRCWHVESS
jgi:hypothetical protein